MARNPRVTTRWFPLHPKIWRDKERRQRDMAKERDPTSLGWGMWSGTWVYREGHRMISSSFRSPGEVFCHFEPNWIGQRTVWEHTGCTGCRDGAQNRTDSGHHWRGTWRKSRAPSRLLLLWLLIHDARGLSHDSTFLHRIVLRIGNQLTYIKFFEYHSKRGKHPINFK